MKISLVSLPFLFVAGVVMAAEGMESAPAADQAALAQDQKVAPKHPDRGDLRHCLDLKTNEAIIRCSEKKPKK